MAYPKTPEMPKLQNARLPKRTGALTLDEFLENVNVRQASVPVVVGPRTQGASDELWDKDVRSFRRQSDIAEMATDKQTSVSKMMVALASHTNPTLQFKADCNAHVHNWFVTDFKRSYQAARVPGKRPWPEFAASLRSGMGLVDADLAAISIVAAVDVVTIDDNRLIVAPLLRDKPYGTSVMDGRTSTLTTLGALCDEALGILHDTAGPGHLHEVARALAMDSSKHTRPAIASKVASRTAALRCFVADGGGGGDEVLSVFDSICLGT